MVYIESVDLSARGIVLPSDRVGMVVAQPFLSLTQGEPYQCLPESKPQQMQLLSDTLRIAREAHHGAPITHFTVFPEYSIPGRDGVGLVQTSLESADWPCGTIVIGGTDGLTKTDFSVLAGEAGTHIDQTHNGLNRIAAKEWVNCGITWVKAANGIVERWFQPKLSPAWQEQNVHYQDMFRGNSMFAFNGPFDNNTQFRFSSLVCFDWIANDLNKKAWCWLVDDLNQRAVALGAEFSLSWLFVIQHNPKPSANSFLTEVGGFFDQKTGPNVHRKHTCLVFANSAGKAGPGRASTFGDTSLVFSREASFVDPEFYPTFSNGGASFRSSTLLGSYHDILFRERGACIHSFAQVNPNSLSAGAAGKEIAVRRPYVFPLTGAARDPRTPSDSVPACVKWLNDELDGIESLGARYPNATLAGPAKAEHVKTVAALRVMPAQAITHTVKLATEKLESDDADKWNRPEENAIEHVVDTVNIVALGFAPVAVGADSAHATIIMSSKVVDILAIRGATHLGCIEHSKNLLPFPRRQVLLISRDRDNTSWNSRFGSFLKTKTPALNSEQEFTDPASGLLHLGYRRLLDIFQNSTTVADLQEAISAELA